MPDLSAVAIGPLATVEGCVVALEAGIITAPELVDQGLERIEQLDGPKGLNAVITVAPSAAEDAQASHQRRATGRPRSPLDGIPFTVKDCIEVAGMPTTHGSRIFEHWIPEVDSPVVARLKAAGMVLLAKVSLDDFAAACFGESSLKGWMRNPHDPGRQVGGSSGGSAVAVAAGYAPMSLGTDTGGSLRIPAALCGVATLRPTSGALSLAGIFPRSPSQDTVGPMTTTIAGLQLTWAALHRNHNSNPPHLAPPMTAPQLRLGVVEGGLAIWGDDPQGPVLERFRQLLGELSNAGAYLVPVEAPPRDLLDQSVAIPHEAIPAVDSYLARPGMPVRDFCDLLTAGREGGMSAHALTTFERHATHRISSDEVAQVYVRRSDLRDYTHRLLETYDIDAVIYPSVQRTALPLGEEQSGVFTRWSEHTGFPSVGVPMGIAAPGDGPCSAELLAPAGADDRLLTIAAVVERHALHGLTARRESA